MSGEHRKIFAGRYAYEKPLGRGAGGAVYLCSDLEVRGRRVAVKVLTAEAFATVQGKMIKREFEILSKLDHPNLVRVYDYGSLPDGGVFLAEEYIDGFSLQDARALIQPAGLVDITLQLLHGLSYLHGMGMIHRDIKPANVMLLWLDDASARPMGKLVDFGLSSADPKRDTLRGGTRSYMAPEIIRGEKGEFKSDLYSLGVTLYYAMCGVLPFGPRTKDDPPTSEEDFRPPEPHRLNPEVPLNLSRFTMILLRQVPGIEYQDAGEAMQALARDSGSFEWVTTGQLANNLDIAAPPVLRGYFERGILADEAQQCDRIVDALAAEPRGKLRVIRAARGLGKTRVLREVASAAKLAGMTAIALHCRPAMDRLELALNMLTGLTDHVEGRGTPVGERLRPTIALLRRLGGWFGSESDSDHADSDWIRESLSDLATLLHNERVVFFVEDGHHADSATLDLLRGWFDRVGRATRPAVLFASEPEARVDAMSRSSDVEVVGLKGLRESDVSYFFETRLGVSGLPAGWLKSVTENSGGDPSYVEELSRHLIDAAILSRRSAIQWHVSLQELMSFQLPKSKRESLRRRLSGFGNSGRELLEILAVVDRPLEWATLRRIAVANGGEASEVDRNLEMLRWRQLVHMDLDDQGRHLRLIDADLREVILEPMAAEWRRAIHRRVGERLGRDWLKTGGDVPEIADHLDAAGHEKATHWLAMAGDQTQHKSLSVALTYWVRALRTQKGAARVETLLKLIEADIRLNQVDIARERLDEAWAVAERSGLDWLVFRTCVEATHIGFADGDLADAHAWLLRLKDVLPVHAQQPAVRVVEGRLLISKGQLGDAEKRLMSTLAQFEHFGDASGEVLARAMLARIRFYRGETDACGRLYAEAVASAREHNVEDALATALVGQGAYQRVIGEFEASRRTLSEAFEWATRAGSPEQCVEALLELGETHMVSGELLQARARAKEARRLAIGLNNVSLECASELLVGELSVREVENIASAVSHMESALARLASMPFGRLQYCEGLARLGRALYKAGDKERSRDLLLKANELAREIGMDLSHIG